jgi:inhibitor of cysteine peptidase
VRSKVELGPGDSGSRRTLAVGDSVEVRLPETPTTGFRWRPVADLQQLRLTDDHFDGAVAPRGAGGQRVLVFEALTAGTAQLRLAKAREWEGVAREEFVVDLEIHPAN